MCSGRSRRADAARDPRWRAAAARMPAFARRRPVRRGLISISRSNLFHDRRGRQEYSYGFRISSHVRRQVTATAPRRGSAAVEAAVVMPVIVTMLLGMLEVGRLVEVQEIMNNAAREGARQAAGGN